MDGALGVTRDVASMTDHQFSERIFSGDARVRRAAMFAALNPDTVVITPTPRVARQLQLDYAEHQLASGQHAWISLPVSAFGAWLAQLWNRCRERALLTSESPLPRLLPDHEERAIWQRVIAASERAESFIQLANTARSAQSAWRTAWQWDIPPATWRPPLNEDCAAFSDYAEQFTAWLDRHSLIDVARLPDVLFATLSTLRNHLPRHIVLLDFDVLSPQAERFLRRLSEHGMRCEHWRQRSIVSEAVSVACPDDVSECYLAARWTRALLAADASVRIAIVVPNLTAQRETIERIFREVLSPAPFPFASSVQKLVHVAGGAVLATLPSIRCVWLLLNWIQAPLSYGEFVQLWLSPFWGNGESERPERMRAEGLLRNACEAKVSLIGLLEKRRELESANCDLAATWAALDALSQCQESWAEAASPRQWLDAISALLKSIAWQPVTPIDLADHWRQLLERFAALSRVLGDIHLEQACTSLRLLADETTLVDDNVLAPVQLLSPRDIQGAGFDYCWVMGCDDDSLPTAPKPNPFIPFSLQRRLNIPGASSASMLQEGRRFVEYVGMLADRVVFSYPVQMADRELHVSPLISHLVACEPESLPQWREFTWWESVHRSARQEPWYDVAASLVPRDALVAGGAAMFEDQAACPFRAYVHHRLLARDVDMPRFGLSARDRGIVLHGALHRLWQNLRDHETLSRLLAQDAQRGMIVAAVTQAIAALRLRRPLTLSSALAALEQQRLETLLDTWLRIEHQRAPFEVSELEAERVFTVGPLRVRARMDRVDRVGDGFAVIDYKTAPASANAWLGPRPNQPQLPLYAIHFGEELAALLFAIVKTGESSFVGTARESALAPKVKAFAEDSRMSAGGTISWPQQIAQWQTDLTQLATDFANGIATIDPKQGATTCRYCDLQTCCRLYDQDAAAENNGDEELVDERS